MKGALMPSMTPLTSYADSYRTIRFERDDGILQMTLHTNGGPMIWGPRPHREVAHALGELSRDSENKVIIITGTGDSFIDGEYGAAHEGRLPASAWADVHRDGTNLLADHLRIEAPIIAAVNGPATIHAELAVMADVVLAAESAVFADKAHFITGTVPGDGVHIVWPELLGLNRARYFLLTGQRISAQEALQLGVVSEVCSATELLPRAWELARQIAAQPPLTVRFFRAALLQRLRRAVLDDLPYGLALEGLAATEFWPQPGLDR
jgi:enoyl-CoA hydratase/carnithine racemase